MRINAFGFIRWSVMRINIRIIERRFISRRSRLCSCWEDILIESDIASSNDGAVCTVPKEISLGSRWITNKRHLECLRFEFVTLVLLHMNIGFAAKDPKVGDIRGRSAPEFHRGTPLKTFHGLTIVDVNSTCDS